MIDQSRSHSDFIVTVCTRLLRRDDAAIEDIPLICRQVLKQEEPFSDMSAGEVLNTSTTRDYDYTALVENCDSILEAQRRLVWGAVIHHTVQSFEEVSKLQRALSVHAALDDVAATDYDGNLTSLVDEMHDFAASLDDVKTDDLPVYSRDETTLYQTDIDALRFNESHVRGLHFLSPFQSGFPLDTVTAWLVETHPGALETARDDIEQEIERIDSTSWLDEEWEESRWERTRLQ